MIQGNDKIVTVTFTARGDSSPSDPTTVVFSVKDPTKTVTTKTYSPSDVDTYDVIRVSAGVYELRVACPLVGNYYVTGRGTGDVKAAAGVQFRVDTDGAL